MQIAALPLPKRPKSGFAEQIIVENTLRKHRQSRKAPQIRYANATSIHS